MPREWVIITQGLVPQFTGETCVICDFSLNLGFPKDFPEKWKVCCYCKRYMEVIANGNRDLIDIYYNGKNVDKKLKNLLDKIEELITLVG